MTAAAALERRVADLIDRHIPNPECPVGVLEDHLRQVLSQPRGRHALAIQTGPANGHTVGTALVEHRQHRLSKTVFDATRFLQGHRADSLLRLLFEQGVDLQVPNARGRSAWMHSLCHGIQASPVSASQQLMGRLVQLDVAALLQDIAPEPLSTRSPQGPSCSLLHVDPDGTTIAAAPLPPEVQRAVENRILQDIMLSGRSAQANRDWARACMACALPTWHPFMAPLCAQWEARVLESQLPPAAVEGAPRSRACGTSRL